MWDEHNTRKPMLLLRLSGLLLLRVAERALSGLLFQEPPRSTRDSSQGTPQKDISQSALTVCQSTVQMKSKICARRRFATHSEQHFSTSAISAPVIRYSMGDEHNTRKPMLLSR